MKDNILEQVYADKNKVAGVSIDDPKEKERIYQQYLQAFKKGVYNYIKEDIDPLTQETVPRKYFSGGITDLAMNIEIKQVSDYAMLNLLKPLLGKLKIISARLRLFGNRANVVNIKKNDTEENRLENESKIFKELTNGTIKSNVKKILSRERNRAVNGYMNTKGKIVAFGNFQNVDVKIRQNNLEFTILSKFWREHPKFKLLPGENAEHPYAVARLRLSIDIANQIYQELHSQDKAQITKNQTSSADLAMRSIPFEKFQLKISPKGWELIDPDGNSSKGVRSSNWVFIFKKGRWKDLVFRIPRQYLIRKKLVSANMDKQEEGFHLGNSFGIFPPYVRGKIQEHDVLAVAYVKPVSQTQTLEDLINKWSVDNRYVEAVRKLFIVLIQNDLIFDIDPPNIVVGYLHGKLQAWVTDAEYLGKDEHPSRQALIQEYIEDIEGRKEVPPWPQGRITSTVLALLKSMSEKLQQRRTALIEKWKDWEPQADGSPKMDENDDVAAVLAGSKPAALVSEYPEGREEREMQKLLINEARSRGFVVNEVTETDGSYKSKSYIIGREKNVGEISMLYSGFVEGRRIADNDYHVRLARALGVPEKLIDHDYNRHHLDSWSQKGELMSIGYSYIGAIYSNDKVYDVFRKGDKSIVFDRIELGIYRLNLQQLPWDIRKAQRISFEEFLKSDTAMLSARNVGGIDLTPANMNLQTQNNNGEINFHMNPAMLAQLQNAPGFVPVIINIQPLKDLQQFLGINSTAPIVPAHA